MLHQDYIGIRFTHTVTVSEVRTEASSTHVLTRLVAVASDHSTDPAPQTVPYVVHSNGTMSTYPTLPGSHEFTYRFAGSIRYPSPS